MFTILPWLTALLVVPFAGLAVSTPADDIVKTVTEKNVVLQRASMTYDTATIRRLITPDFTLITSSGRVLNAEDLVNDVGDKSVKWFNNDSDDVRVRAYGDDCAIVTAILRQRFEYQGKIVDYRVRFTDTWVKIDGEWRYAAGHASKLPETLH